ncbi:MAG: hypothetical protein IKS48_11940 [Eubacterium sp.]|nr:hypothetical protein [Eubacterium sp.]
MKTITEKYTLDQLESEISACISDYEYWGDLNLSFGEFNIIGDLFRKKIQSYPGAVDLDGICKRYSCSLTTFCVFLIRYKYNTNFWGLLSDELNLVIEHDWQSGIGSCIRSTFRKYKFDFSEIKNDPWVNIAPIIFEACLPPDSSLDDLFYVLNYDSYNVFDPEVIIDEMIDMRSYLIRKPMLQFLKRFKNDKAIDFLLEVHDTMLAVNQHLSTDSRYRNRYIDWTEKEKEKTRINSRKSKDRQTRPYLIFDNGKKGLCITLPRIVIHSEWTEEVVWHIKSDNGFEKTIYCKVFSDDNVRFVESINVAVSPSANYSIAMDDEENLDDEGKLFWEIKGIDNDRPSIFNSYGRLINAGYIQRPNMVLIYNAKTKINYSDNLFIECQSYPTDIDGYKIECVTPTGGEAEIFAQGKNASLVLRTKPHLDLSLNGQKLFLLSKDCYDIELFTEIPSLVIRYQDGECISDIEIRIDGDITTLDKLEGDIDKEIELKKSIKKSSKSYGIHNVRVYQYGKFIKQIEFAYVPKIRTNYSSTIKWPDMANRKNKKSYYFVLPDNWDIDFNDCDITRDGDKTIIEYLSSVGSLNGTLKYSYDEVTMNFRFMLPVNPYEIKMFGKNDTTEENITDKLFKTDLFDFADESFWIEFSMFENYINDTYSLRLKSVNGIEQEEVLKLTNTGSGNKDLGVFKDTLKGCPLPAQIVLYSEKNDEIPLIYIKEHLQLSAYPGYTYGKENDYISLSVNEGETDIDISRFGYDYKSWKVGFSESKLSKKGPYRGYKIPERLEEGIYIINTSSNSEEDIFEDEENEVELVMNNNIVYVPHVKENKYNINTSAVWLDTLMRYICKNKIEGEKFVEGWLSIGGIKKLEKSEFNKYDIEKLVALAYFVNSKISNNSKTVLCKMMQRIALYFLGRGDRIRIIELLVELNVSQEVFDICINNYYLLLFYGDKKEAKQLASKVAKYSTELSMLLLMSAEVSMKDCILKERYRDLIGKESLRYMLDVPRIDNPQVMAEEQKNFLRETDSSVRIRLDDAIVGSEKDIQSMIKLDKWNNPKLDISLKPEDGLYFAHIKYIDQYLNWYKLNSDEGGVKSEVRDKCKKLMDSTKEEIEFAINVLKSNVGLSDMTRQYCKSMEYRCSKPNSDYFSIGKYLYFQGLAAFLSRIPTEYEKYDKYRMIGIKYMSSAYEIAPRLSRRDTLMAGTFIYLKTKEKKLCQ